MNDLGHLISSDGSLNLSGLLSGLTGILNLPLDTIFSALKTGNISQLTNLVQPLVDHLLSLPLVGSLLLLLSNILQVNFLRYNPLMLIVAVFISILTDKKII